MHTFLLQTNHRFNGSACLYTVKNLINFIRLYYTSVILKLIDLYIMKNYIIIYIHIKFNNFSIKIY